uniref:Uncharacterized protein n=1 Tax=Cajanus cajan TaxID=3821 RepID=A0A151T3B6_CAJCA|nr:hypothetical protein KK1_016023 [Cajanus cajan]
MVPSPSLSTPPIMRRHSAREHSSPRLRMTVFSSSALMEPLPSMSKTAKASFRFSRTSSESTPLVLSSMNSWRLMQPSPSPSTSRIIFSSSCSVPGCPRLPIMDPSSDAEIFPSPFTSNFLNTSSSSPARRVRDRTESDVDREGAAERFASLLRLKRDLKPIVVEYRSVSLFLIVELH